jgi:hypothetical protein
VKASCQDVQQDAADELCRFERHRLRARHHRGDNPCSGRWTRLHLSRSAGGWKWRPGEYSEPDRPAPPGETAQFSCRGRREVTPECRLVSETLCLVKEGMQVEQPGQERRRGTGVEHGGDADPCFNRNRGFPTTPVGTGCAASAALKRRWNWSRPHHWCDERPE